MPIHVLSIFPGGTSAPVSLHAYLRISCHLARIPLRADLYPRQVAQIAAQLLLLRLRYLIPCNS
jgi:hypothetical protein